MATQEFPENTLPKLNRYVTTHNDDGKSIIAPSVATEAVWQNFDTAGFFQGYVTKGYPVNLTKDADIDTYKDFLASPPGLTVSNGSVVRFVDMPPGVVSPMHRTTSIDYGVVLEGTIELILDGGETRTMTRGDLCIQRATNHAWKNVGTEWGRMMFVLLPASGQLSGKVELKEEFPEEFGNLKRSD